MTINDHDANLFGRNLCLTRRRRGLSQEKLAQRTGLCRDTIYKIEMGQRSPRLDTLLVLIDALGVDLGELFEGFRARGKRGEHSGPEEKRRLSAGPPAST